MHCPFTGGHALHVSGKAESFELGQKMAAQSIKSGNAKKKFMDMLHAQGVTKQNVKDLCRHRKIESGLSPVLPVAHYFTHLSAEHTGENDRYLVPHKIASMPFGSPILENASIGASRVAYHFES